MVKIGVFHGLVEFTNVRHLTVLGQVLGSFAAILPLTAIDLPKLVYLFSRKSSSLAGFDQWLHLKRVSDQFGI